MILPIKTILKETCKYYDVTPEHLLSDTRKREVTEMRQVFHYLSVKHTKQTLSYIGGISKDHGRPEKHNHATVSHGKSNIENLIFTDKKLKKEVEELTKTLRKSEHVTYTDTEIVFKKELDLINERLDILEQNYKVLNMPVEYSLP